jgi:hypothetical protein
MEISVLVTLKIDEEMAKDKMKDYEAKQDRVLDGANKVAEETIAVLLQEHFKHQPGVEFVSATTDFLLAPSGK